MVGGSEPCLSVSRTAGDVIGQEVAAREQLVMGTNSSLGTVGFGYWSGQRYGWHWMTIGTLAVRLGHWAAETGGTTRELEPSLGHC